MLPKKLICPTLSLFAGIVAAVLFASLLADAAAQATTCDVPTATHSTIQSAVDDAGCDVVNLTDALYVENVTIGRSVTIQGQGMTDTVVDGNVNGSVFAIQPGAVVTLADMAIANGNAVSGGGIYNDHGTLTISSTMVVSNTATSNSNSGGGGGIYNSGGLVTIVNSTIGGNCAFWGGIVWNDDTLTIDNSTLDGNNVVRYCGGIYNDGGKVTIRDSTLGGNTSIRGAGIHNQQGAVSIINSTINGIHSGSGDGAILNTGGIMTITNSVLDGNSGSGGIQCDWGTLRVFSSTLSHNSSGSTGAPGGIYASDSTITIANSTLSDNSAYVGGGIRAEDSTVSLINSTVSGNSASFNEHGGGIYSKDSKMNIVNSTVSGNSVAHGLGGGIYSTGWITISSSTLSGNSAALGGGIYNFAAATLQNTIVAGNTAWGASPDCSGSISSLGYNLIGDTSDCAFSSSTGDLLNVDARLSPLIGSPGYHPLRPDSPAIHAGNPAGCTDHLGGPLTTDQRGFPRFGRCDIGAYEIQPIAFSTKTASEPIVLVGSPLTYTIVLTNGGASNITNVWVTDTLPISLTYSTDSLTATSGNYGYNNGAITWTGSVDAGMGVTIAFGTAVGQTAPPDTSIANSAVISGAGEVITRTATIVVEWYWVYLPVVLKNQ